MNCKKCGKEFEGSFCPNCGTSINEAPTVCEKCGKIYVGQFCPNGCNSPYYNMIKKKKNKDTVVAIIVVIIVIFIALIGIIFGEDTPSDTSSTLAPTGTSSVEEIEYIEVTANDLWRAFSDNEVLAEQTYTGKYIRITGVVGEINSKGALTSANVLLIADDAMFSCVQCNFSKNNSSQLANLNKGDTVTIIGYCGKLNLNVQVSDCSVE